MIDDSQFQGKRFLVGCGKPVTAFLQCCPFSNTLVLYAPALDRNVVCAIECKRWGCEICGRKKVRKYAIRVAEAKPDKLLTLTTNPASYENPRAAYDNARRAWSTLAKRWRRTWGDFEYFRVLESHKNGYPHFHGVLRAHFADQKWISRQWAELHDSPIVDIGKIEQTDSAFYYVVKYLSKLKYVTYTHRRLAWSRAFFPNREPPLCPWGKSEGSHMRNTHPADYINDEAVEPALQQLTPTAWVLDSVKNPVDWSAVETQLALQALESQTEEIATEPPRTPSDEDAQQPVPVQTKFCDTAPVHHS